MIVFYIDIVGTGIQSEEMPISRTVRGEVRINTGSEKLDKQIEDLFQRARIEAYALLDEVTPTAKA